MGVTMDTTRRTDHADYELYIIHFTKYAMAASGLGVVTMGLTTGEWEAVGLGMTWLTGAYFIEQSESHSIFSDSELEELAQEAR